MPFAAPRCERWTGGQCIPSPDMLLYMSSRELLEALHAVPELLMSAEALGKWSGQGTHAGGRWDTFLYMWDAKAAAWPAAVPEPPQWRPY